MKISFSEQRKPEPQTYRGVSEDWPDGVYEYNGAYMVVAKRQAILFKPSGRVCRNDNFCWLFAQWTRISDNPTIAGVEFAGPRLGDA